jgi:molecular chaperone GrpE
MRRRKTQGYNTVSDGPEKGNGDGNGEAAPDGAEASGDAAASNGAGGAGDALVDTGTAPAEAAPPPVESAAPAADATTAERLATLLLERDEYKDRMMRVAAEFENWKKRARTAETQAVSEARERVLKDMLEVVDNLERAVGMQAGGNGAVDGGALLKGVDLVLRLFKQKLERHEVKPFDAAGQPFDPRVHEAISRVASADVPSGSVAVELQKGYRVGERLLRPALVSVSSGPDGAGK